MGKYRKGAIIKLMRNSLDLTQEQLIESIDGDICSVETLSRAENGKQKINLYTFNLLMDKMGSVIGKSESLLSTCEMKLFEKKDMLHIARVDRDYEKADAILEKISLVLDMQYPLNRQFYIENKANIDYHLKRIDTDEYLKKLEEAIKCTIKKFDEIDKNKWPYTVTEAVIVMNMARIHGKKSGEQEALQRLYELKNALEQGYMDKHSFATIWLSVVSNLASYLGNIGEFEKSIELNLNAIEFSKDVENGGLLAGFIYDMMWDEKELMKKEGVSEEKIKQMEKYYLKKAYHIARAMNDNVNIGFLNNKIEEL